MFKRKYKYFITFWYQLENSESFITDGYMEMNKPINYKEHIPKIRKQLKDEVEKATGEKCNFIAIINWEKLK